MTTVAAETLFALYQDRLRRYLSRASGETELARDLTQEVFLRVSRVAIPVAPESQLAGWLFRIARNVALDHHRQRHRRPEEALGRLDRAKGASQETTTALNQALSSLPELDRDVFLMREMSGSEGCGVLCASDGLAIATALSERTANSLRTGERIRPRFGSRSIEN